MLSLLYEGRLNTFSPVTHWDRIGLHAIRPLIYVPESEIVYFANRQQLPVLTNACPVDGYTKREEAAQQLRLWNQRDHHTTNRIFSAIQNGGLKGWSRS